MGMELRGSNRKTMSLPSITNNTNIDENCREEKDLSLEFHFEELRNKVKPLFNVLGRIPDSALEKALVYSEDIAVNSNVIRNCENLINELNANIEEQHKNTRDLWNDINTLWKELESNNEPQLEFTNAHCGIKKTLIALKEEYVKRKEEKAQRIAQFIGFLRTELIQIWTQCLISDEERNSFAAFYDNTFTEELLETHKVELEKWKIYHEKNQEVLLKAKKREEMWNKLRELEAKNDDPAKFINRGGTLLKDQTMLASIMKNLPKLETELKRLASQFEVEHGRKVKILGQDIHEMIDRDWEVYNNEKIVKKQATRAKVRQSVAPVRVPMGPPTSVNKAEKRPPPVTTILTTPKRQRCSSVFVKHQTP